MVNQIVKKLKSDTARQTRSDRLLAHYFETNLRQIPFETAASIAEKVGVSPMTAGRFLRRLGYNGLDEFKKELQRVTNSGGPKSSAWELSGSLEELQRDQNEGKLTGDLVAQQIEVLQSMAVMTHSERWNLAVDTITSAKTVFVASFQNISGIARYFSEQLHYIRSDVTYMDGSNGTYLEMFGSTSKDRLLILIDCRRFASKTRPLAQQARNAGVKVLLITDIHCDWAAEDSDISLILPSMRWRTWDSFMPLAALLDLLVTNCLVAAGDAVKERAKLVRSLQDTFGEFVRR
ncbi:MurR/RpiR family transcriptional regulator [Paraburkholderia nemoris]|uniref:MurR/RpiR family transcriptional regulator n=1 Tax=Paraburkholderia nemoris TaxID=2793076 RepID=UPI0038B957AA